MKTSLSQAQNNGGLHFVQGFLKMGLDAAGLVFCDFRCDHMVTHTRKGWLGAQ